MKRSLLLNPGGLDETAVYNDHASGGPYIMYGVTPFEHLTVPVKPVVTGAGNHRH